MDIEQMRIRMGEMAAEIERLQSVIDGNNADADEAFESYLETFGGPDTNAWHDAPVDGVFKDGFNRGLLARPIPAQQSPAVAVPDGGKLAKLFSDFEFMATGNGFDVTRSSANTGYQCRKTAELFATYSDGWGSGFDFGCQSPRITEQDASATIADYIDWQLVSPHIGGANVQINLWLKDSGRALLDKLNKLNGDTNG